MVFLEDLQLSDCLSFSLLFSGYFGDCMVALELKGHLLSPSLTGLIL